MLHVSQFLEYVDHGDPETSTIQKILGTPKLPRLKNLLWSWPVVRTEFNVAEVFFMRVREQLSHLGHSQKIRGALL